MSKIIGCLCVLLLSFFAVKHLLPKGYFPMHDDTQVARVVVMGKALQEGQFPVRWVSDLGYGYGYPIFNFYGPLPYYVGGGLYASGVDSVVAAKIMFGVGALIAPVALFIFLEPLLGFLGAMTGAVLFMYAPYHAVEVYIRGAVGEYWALSFVPLVLYGAFRSVKEKNPATGIIAGGISLAAVITSHTILGFLTAALYGISMVVFWIIRGMQKKLRRSSFTGPVSILFLGLLLSAFFWLPAFFELSATSVVQMVNSAGTTFFDHFVCIGQLWNSPWGYAGSAPGCVDGMSFKFGKLHVGVAALSLIVWMLLLKKKRLQGKNIYMLVSVIALIVCTALTLQLSSPIWQVIPFTSFIQYPWRFLAFGIMLIAMCGAYVVSVPKMPIVRIGLAAGIVGLTILVNTKIFTPQYIYSRDSYAFGTQEELRFFKSSISDEYLPPGITKPKMASDSVKAAVSGTATLRVLSLAEKDTSLDAKVESAGSQTLTIKKAWFPGWVITINGKQIEPVVERGLPSVNIPAGISIIRMRFTDTPVRTLGNILSVCAVLAIGVLYIYGKKADA